MVTKFDIQDLYTRGADFKIPGPDNSFWDLHIRKLNPVEQKKAVRAANAARVRLMKVLTRDPETDDERLLLEEQLEDIGDGSRDDMIDFLVSANVTMKTQAIEQEVAADEKWEEEIQALHDAWDEDVQADYALGPDERSAETQDIYDQLKEFADDVEKKVEGAKKIIRNDLEKLSDEDLREKVMKMLLERDAGMVWLKTFRDYQILYGIEDKETSERIYSSIEEVVSLPTELYTHYLHAIELITVPTLDLK